MTQTVTTAAGLRQRLGRFGIFSGPPSRTGIDPVALATAAERAGFASAWVGGGNATPADFEVLASMLAATSKLIIATGIVNIWAWDPVQLRAAASGLGARYPGRLILGLGVSHRKVVEGLGHAYERPLAHMERFIDELDHPAQHGTQPGLPPVVLAALGPKMLKLSAEQALGAHPYFTTAEHTRQARSILGGEPLLIPEIAGSLAGGEAGLAAVRAYAQRYLQLPNYVNNLRREGFSEDDLAGSDKLLAAVTPHGAGQLRDGVAAHLAAGADHVVIQPLGPGGGFALDDLQPLGEAVASLAA